MLQNVGGEIDCEGRVQIAVFSGELRADSLVAACFHNSKRKLPAHYGFSKMPFRRDLAPGMLHRHGAHAEAAARISWCISEHALGVITGEVGAARPWPCAPPWPAWMPPATP